MNLSLKERLIIANQLRILEKLYPEEAEDFAKNRSAIEKGYTLHYKDLVEWFYDEMSEDECLEVLDILNMYRAITFSTRDLQNEFKIEQEKIRFKGFDGNNETKQFSYTTYFIVELNRFQELTYDAEYPNFNSHMEMLPKYRRMLKVWKAIPQNFELSREQILELVSL